MVEVDTGGAELVVGGGGSDEVVGSAVEEGSSEVVGGTMDEDSTEVVGASGAVVDMVVVMGSEVTGALDVSAIEVVAAAPLCRAKNQRKVDKEEE